MKKVLGIILLGFVLTSALFAAADDQGKALFDAVSRKETYNALELIENGANVNYEYYGQTVLNKALQQGMEQVAIELILNGATLYYLDIWQTIDSKMESLALTFTKLIGGDSGVPPNFEHNGKTFLAKAVEREMEDVAVALLDAGADPNTQYSSDTTVFERAADRKLSKITFSLVQHGAKFTDRTFFTVVSNGDNATAMAMLKAGANPNAEKHGASVLYESVSDGNTEMAKAIIDAGAEISDEVFYRAVNNENEELALYMLNAGANPNSNIFATPVLTSALNNEMYDLVQALMDKGAVPADQVFINTVIEGNRELALAMIKAGANPNSTQFSSQTVLSIAVEKGYNDVVFALVDAGAKIKSYEIYVGFKYDNKEALLKFIDSGVNPDIEIDYKPFLTMAIEKRQSEAAIALVNKGATVSFDNAYWAVVSGDADLLRVMINAGYDINLSNSPNKFISRNAENPLLYTALFEGHVECAKALVEAGADVNYTMKDRRTGETRTILDMAVDTNDTGLVSWIVQKGGKASGPNLKTALDSGNNEMALLLLDAGADVFYHYDNNSMMCIAAEKGSAAVVRKIYDKGGDPNKTYGSGDNTPMYYAIKRGDLEIVNLLISFGAQLNNKENRHVDCSYLAARYCTNAAVVRALKTAGCEFNWRWRGGLNRTPLIIAAINNPSPDVVKLILSYDTRVLDDKDSTGTTALMYACANSNSAVVKILLDAGANIKAVDSRRKTPLIHAAESGKDSNTLILLLDRGANPKAKDRSGKTAYDYAIENPALRTSPGFEKLLTYFR